MASYPPLAMPKGTRRSAPVDVRGPAALGVHMHRDAVARPNYKREQTRSASGFAHEHPSVAAGADDCFARCGVVELTIELATER